MAWVLLGMELKTGQTGKKNMFSRALAPFSLFTSLGSLERDCPSIQDASQRTVLRDWWLGPLVCGLIFYITLDKKSTCFIPFKEMVILLWLRFWWFFKAHPSRMWDIGGCVAWEIMSSAKDVSSETLKITHHTCDTHNDHWKERRRGDIRSQWQRQNQSLSCWEN